MVCFKEARDKTEYKINAALAKTEVRSGHRAFWDEFVTHLEHETHQTQPKVYKILKQMSKALKETKQIHVYIKENILLQYYTKL